MVYALTRASGYPERMPKADPKKYPSPRDRDDYRSADGTVHVVLLDAKIWCPICEEYRDASQVGLRMMEDGTIRNQDHCKLHR